MGHILVKGSKSDNSERKSFISVLLYIFGISNGEDSSVNGRGGTEPHSLPHDTRRKYAHLRPIGRNTINSVIINGGETRNGRERSASHTVTGDTTDHVVDSEDAASELLERDYIPQTPIHYTFDESGNRWTVKKILVTISVETWNNKHFRERERLWPSDETIDSLPNHYYINILKTDDQGILIVHCVDIIDSLLHSLPHPLSEIVRNLQNSFSKLESVKLLQFSDSNQILLNVILALIEETGVHNLSPPKLRLEILRRMRSCLQKGILRHYIFEEFNILGKESENTLLSIHQDVEKLQQYMMNDVSETTLLANRINGRGKVNAEMVELSSRGFESYDRSCHDPHYHRLQLTNELNFLRTKDELFNHVELADKDSKHLGEAKEYFLKVVDLGNSYRLGQFCTLAQLCITSLSDSRPQTSSNAIELSRQCQQQKENGVDFIQTEEVTKAGPAEKTAYVAENSFIDSLGESHLALMEIYRIQGDLERMKHHIDQLCIILPEMVISKVEIAVILLEEGKYYLAVGKIHHAKANLQQALAGDPNNLDVLLYLCLIDRENAPSHLQNWLEEEVENRRQKNYLYFFSEFDLEYLEDFQELYTEVRFLMAFEDANVKFLENEPDTGISTISRVHFPARSVLSFIAYQTLRDAKRLDAKSEAKLLGIARNTASRSSDNAKYQAWSLFGHLQKGLKARESYKRARAAFGDKCSYLILKREWEYSRDEIKGSGNSG